MGRLFGTDGVRGLANGDLTPELAMALAGAAVRVLAGVEPTPGAAYLSHMRDCPAAVLSASHNPFPDNGIKFFARGGRKLTDEIEERFEAELDAILAGSRPPPQVEGAAVGTVRPEKLGEEYAAHLLTVLEGRRLDGLRVVIDCGNGAATVTAPWVLTQLGAKVDNLAIGAQPDGTNINAGCGSTDPGPLQAEVVATGAVAGLAFDGDADRLVAVDERGGLVDGDHILAVAALDLRARGLLRHDTVVATVMANLGFHRAMAAEGIRVETTPVGDRAVLEAMEAGGFSLGGEQSGHIIFGDLATTGDGLLSGLVLLDVLARSGRPLSELASIVQKLPQVLRNVRVADRLGLPDATAFWAEVEAIGAELGDTGRVLVRPSGTEPLVRIMVEASSGEAATAYTDRLEAALTAVLGKFV